MKLVNPKYFDVIRISDENPETLILENPHVFKNVIQDIVLQAETDTGEFVLSEESSKIVSFSKYAMVLTDIFHYNLYSKQLKTKLISMISSSYSEIEGKEQVVEDLYKFGIQIMNEMPYPISFKSSISFLDLVKFMDFSFDYSEYSSWERFMETISLSFELLNLKILILVNFKDYVDEAEYKELIKFFQNKKIPLLMIERHMHKELDDISHLSIIDSDLCVL